MSKQVQAQGLTGLIKKYLSRDNFAQYVTGLVIITFLILLFWEFNNDAPDKFWIAIFIAIIVTFLLLDVVFGMVNIFKERYNVKTDNWKSILKTAIQRRDDPTLTQQLRGEMAGVKAEMKGIRTVIHSLEELSELKESITTASMSVEFEKDEAEMAQAEKEIKNEIKELEEQIKKDVEELEKIS